MFFLVLVFILCQVQAQDLWSSCKDGATCYRSSQSGSVCYCNLGYTTIESNGSANPCSKNPCKNGGTCNSSSEGFKCRCRWGFSGNDCSFEECHRPLGIQSGKIEDWQITMRPFRYDRYEPRPWRLLLEATGGREEAWKPYWSYRGLWFQVHFHNEYTWVAGIATQGRVTTYKLRYRRYRVWPRWYREIGQRYAKEFTGNTHENTVVHNILETPIRASVFRIYPWTWRGAIEMKMELYGCKDVCLYKPCKNGGTCVSDYINGNYTCVCPDGFYGDTCRLGDLCKLSNPCLNGGNCSAVRSWPYFICTCPFNYTGFDCGIGIVDPCNDSFCLNDGTCQRIESWPYSQCNCTSGYAGFNCGTYIGDPCSNTFCPEGWTCTLIHNSTDFQCDYNLGNQPTSISTGYTCQPDPCRNGGTCSVHGEGYFKCSCPKRFFGYYCQHERGYTCQPDPCRNGGTCSVDSKGYFTCSCPKRFFGYFCEYKQDDVCSANPCLNEGTCTPNNNSLGFECSCPSGYIGFNCGLQRGNPCSDSDNPEPCKNGGNCTQQDTALGYTCKCTTEYIGFNCGFLKDDPCFPNPCLNGGNCSRDVSLKDFICNCTFGFVGKRCESKIVHGNWSLWTPWPNCNKPCNNGTRKRRRACDNPRPAFGGKNCTGLTYESEHCNQEKCPGGRILNLFFLLAC